MPVILAILGAIGGAIYYYIRTRGPIDSGRDLIEAANDVRLAARRFGFKRNANRHPAEDVEDPKVAIATLAVAFIELDKLPSQDQQIALLKGLQNSTHVTLNDAEELAVLGRWLMGQCGGAEQTISRLSRKLYKLGGPEQVAPLMEVLGVIGATGDGRLSDRQRDAIDDIKLAFKL